MSDGLPGSECGPTKVIGERSLLYPAMQVLASGQHPYYPCKEFPLYVA